MNEELQNQLKDIEQKFNELADAKLEKIKKDNPGKEIPDYEAPMIRTSVFVEAVGQYLKESKEKGTEISPVIVEAYNNTISGNYATLSEVDRLKKNQDLRDNFEGKIFDHEVQKINNDKVISQSELDGLAVTAKLLAYDLSASNVIGSKDEIMATSECGCSMKRYEVAFENDAVTLKTPLVKR